MSFASDFEALLAHAKAQFVALQQCRTVARAGIGDAAALAAHSAALQAVHAQDVARLRALVKRRFDEFDALAVSSLLAVPAQPLSADERVLHRVWLGGPLPKAVREAMRQWHLAVDRAACHGARRWRELLWTWDADELADDPRFERAPGPGYRLGRYRCDDGVVAGVAGLRALLADFLPAHEPLVEALHARRWYVHLSDIARTLALRMFGGVYMDADTLPHASAPVFLAQPEVPDFLGVAPAHATGRSRPHVSWLNGREDENGWLVSRKDNAALDQVIVDAGRRLSELPAEVPFKAADARSAAFAAHLHTASYGAWRRHLGASLMSQHELLRDHAVWPSGRPERRVIGLVGMRLEQDWLTGRQVPLDADEAAARAECLAGLAHEDGRPHDPSALATLARHCIAEEVALPGWAPQLRTDAGNLHYYSFLSSDPALDRVNTVFGEWQSSENARRLARPDAWLPLRGASTHAPTPRPREGATA